MSDELGNDRMERLRELWRQRDEHWDAQRYAEFAATGDQLIALLKALRAEWEPQGPWTPDLQNDLARAHRGRGIAAFCLGEPVETQIAHYDEAIRIGQILDLRVEKYREGLATAYLNRGVAKHDASGHGSNAALADYDAAIELMEALRAELEPAGRWTEEQRNDLALAYMNRSIAKQDASGHGPSAALADYAAAIDLMEALRAELEPTGRWTEKQRNDLALAYMNRGTAKQHASGHGPGAALIDYATAIELMEALRAEMEPAGRWTEKQRNDLAKAYMGRGNAKQHASGHGPGAALADYDAAIALMEALRAELEPAGRWEVGLRNDLATAYSNRGNAKQDASGHSPGAALADYDAAIELMKALRAELEPSGRWEVGLRNDLAKAYMNRGTAKQHASGHGPDAALADYDAAIDLLRPFLEGPAGSRRPVMVEVASRAFWGKANALLASHAALAAADAADEGLRLLTDLEIDGTFWLRSLRESLFATTLNAYFQAGQSQFLPEIILEHLEPTHPGAAPTSVAMHEAAIEYLRQAMHMLFSQPQPSTKPVVGLIHTLRRLETLRTLYFGGTASSARLQAAERERTDGPAAAQPVLERYIEQRPNDPEGYLALAEFLARHRQSAAAITTYQNAAVALLGNAPAQGEMEPYIVRVAEIAALILKLKLLQQPLPDTLDREATFRLLLGALNLSHWLYRDFPNALFAAPRWQTALQRLTGRTEQWRDALASALDPVAAQIETYLHDLLGKFETTTRQQALDRARGELYEQGQAMARTLCLGLGIPWDTFGEAVTAAWLERWTFLQQDWQRGDQAQRRALEEQLAEGLAHTVSELTRQLHPEALATSYATLQTELGPIWNLLRDSDEARFLACGHHWLSQLHQPESARFAGLELGLAVETGLLTRIFAPLKAWLVKSGQCDHITLDPDDWSYKAGLFLAGKTSAVEFGPMAGAFGRSLKHPPEELAGYYRHLAAYLDNLPNPKPLRDAKARKRRAADLEKIKGWRNRCAHPEAPPSQEDLQTMWNLVAADPDAFFRYFGAACLPPDPAPVSGER